jgi:hypothetical protein
LKGALLDAALLAGAGLGLNRLLRRQAQWGESERCKKEGAEDLHEVGFCTMIAPAGEDGKAILLCYK